MPLLPIVGSIALASVGAWGASKLAVHAAKTGGDPKEARNRTLASGAALALAGIAGVAMAPALLVPVMMGVGVGGVNAAVASATELRPVVRVSIPSSKTGK